MTRLREGGAHGQEEKAEKGTLGVIFQLDMGRGKDFVHSEKGPFKEQQAGNRTEKGRLSCGVRIEF